jgi:hypothetical protein
MLWRQTLLHDLLHPFLEMQQSQPGRSRCAVQNKQPLHNQNIGILSEVPTFGFAYIRYLGTDLAKLLQLSETK